MRAARTLLGVAALTLAAAAILLGSERRAPRIGCSIRDPARGAAAMLEQVTRPAEAALAAWPAVRASRSATRDGETRLVVDFAPCVPPCDETLILALRRRLITAGLPMEQASIQRLDETPPSLDVAVLGGEEPARSQFALEVLRPALLALPEVERVDAFGSNRWRVVVTPLAAELQARGATAADLVTSLCDLGTEHAAGRVLDGGMSRPVSVRERVRSLDQLADRPLALGAGTSPLRDVAGVELTAASEGSRFTAGADEGVLLRVRGGREPARDRLRHLDPPAGIRLVVREAADEQELAFDGAPSSVIPPTLGERAWATWLADTDRLRVESPRPLAVPAAPRGVLLVPHGMPLAPLAATLGPSELRLLPSAAAELWLSAADDDRLQALLQRALLAAEALHATLVAPSPVPPLLVFTLRADLDAGARAAIGSDLDAALGRRDCGSVEIPGVWPAIELAPTRTPRIDLLPVRVSLARAPVPLAAVLAEPATAPASSTFASPTERLRRNGWPAACLRFTSTTEADAVRRQLGSAGGEVLVERLASRAAPGPSRGRATRYALALLAAISAGVAIRPRTGAEPANS